MGRPKALVVGADGRPWVVGAREHLIVGGCDQVTVVVGAAAAEVVAALPPGARTVAAEGWEQGMAASLAAGLRELMATPAEVDLGVVMLVDLPSVTAEVIARVVGRASGPGTIVRAAYAGRPGHPVVVGRDHWSAMLASLADGSPDRGASDWLSSQPVGMVECADLADGHDVDTRAALARTEQGSADE